MQDLFGEIAVAPTLADAILALSARDDDHAAVRNDVGYNGGDTTWGNRLAGLARSGRLRWRTGEYAETRRRLAKYAKQLKGYGIDYAAIPETEPASAPAPVAAATRREPEQLAARVAGRCALCGGTIPAGATFTWGTNRGDRVHAPSCEGRTQAPAAPRPVAPSPVRALESVDLDQLRSVSARSAADILGPGGLVAAALPGYQARDSQVRLAGAIQSAIESDTHLVAEAPTGTGKSLAYLAAIVASGKRAIVSTAIKTLQEQLADKDAPFLSGVAPFSYAVLKGRSNYLCDYRLDELDQRTASDMFGAFRTQESAAAWPAVRAWATETEDGDLERSGETVPGELRELLTVDSDSCLGQRCPVLARCKVERAKRRAEDAQVVIVNHALLLRDLMLRDSTGGAASLLPANAVAVLDEAHHLEDQATDAFGLEVSLATVARIVRRLETLTVKHAEVRQASRSDAVDETMTYTEQAQTWMVRAAEMDAAVTALFAWLETVMGETNADALRIPATGARGQSAVQMTADLAARMAGDAPAWLDGAQRESWTKLAASAEKLALALAILTAEQATPDAETVRFAKWDGQGDRRRLVLCSKPVDVSGELRRMLFAGPEYLTLNEGRPGERRVRVAGYESVIAVSATVASDNGFVYWRSRVGLDRAAELMVDSPFDYAANALLYVPSGERGAALDPSRARDESSRDRYFADLAAEMERLVSASAGGAFLLFTSGTAMREVYARIADRLLDRGLTVLLQGDAPRGKLAADFKADGNAVLFGLKSFWEGVDIQGSALRLVAVDKMPFTPPSDPVWAARCAAVDRKASREMAWFYGLALPTAVIALKQGFGRLIRTNTDRGTVALLDGRLSSKGYGPRVIAALPPAGRVDDLESVLDFYGPF